MERIELVKKLSNAITSATGLSPLEVQRRMLHYLEKKKIEKLQRRGIEMN